MRRYAFYFLTGTLTFVIGLFVVNLEFFKKETSALSGQTFVFNNYRPLKFYSSENKLNEKPKVRFTCTNKRLQPLWNELKKDKDFKEASQNFYENADCEKMIELQTVDLNNDGKKEFVLWGSDFNLCGATGNCPIWIYEIKNSKYKLLLQSGAYNDETKWFEIIKSKSNGYQNILLKSHYSASEVWKEFFKFNAGKYVRYKCLLYDYFPYEKNPSVTTCKEFSRQIERQLRESQNSLQNQ